MLKRNKFICIVLIIFILVCLTIGYSFLNTTLTINGTSKIQKNTWDVHFDNIKVNEKSVVANVEPTVSNNTIISNFEIVLKKPGDFYEFTVDAINDGSLDAMIDSIIKTPDLTTEQQMYLNYSIEYQNAEQITTKQLIKSGEFVRLKVRVEYKKDITVSDLPTNTEILSLGFNINYVQSDGTGSVVLNNGVELFKIVSGDYDTPGSEICIGEECFYVLYSDDDTVTMLAKYNLHVGNVVVDLNEETEEYILQPLENPTGIQDSSAIGVNQDLDGNINFPIVGVVSFSESGYWEENGVLKPEYGETYDNYSANVYDSNSILYPYVENYRRYLISQGVTPIEARILYYEDSIRAIEILNQEDDPPWFYSTTYWSGTSFGPFINMEYTIIMFSNSELPIFPVEPQINTAAGVRPVIVISKNDIAFEEK